MKALSVPNWAVKGDDLMALGSKGAGVSASLPELMKERVKLPGALGLSSSPGAEKNWSSLSEFALLDTYPSIRRYLLKHAAMRR
jgi:hypothetical protein